MLDKLREQSRTAVRELMEAAQLKKGELLVVGCSSSEAVGKRIGTFSSREAAQAIFEGLYPVLQESGVYLAAQCCEHLNRALMMEEEALLRHGLERVNVVPQPKAGGSFATAAFEAFARPVAAERVRAHAGMDIGGTLIGMHLREVAVPIRLSLSHIGEAVLLCARTRPKCIGGVRACYDESLM
ncbi:MAG: TIGR01440 family protein [Clostridiales bacterium]|nr:TIGR01440 family protein [Clostridiales bacterium]